jgi:hypothetical protein
MAVLLLLFAYIPTALTQDCSATKLCATGCCSQFGFCGTDSDHCGAGCLSTCDYKLGCDASNPCSGSAAGTCCSKYGFCGLGPDCKYQCPSLLSITLSSFLTTFSLCSRCLRCWLYQSIILRSRIFSSWICTSRKLPFECVLQPVRSLGFFVTLFKDHEL